MRIAGIYLNDNDVLALADRLRKLGLVGSADSLTNAYYRDARELDLDLAAFESHTLIPALDDGPASFEELCEKLTDRARSIAR